MNIEAKTTYDYDTLKQFRQTSAPDRIFTLFITGALALLYGIMYFDNHSQTTLMIFAIFLGFFVLSLYGSFRQGGAGIKNALNLDSVYHYTFLEEGMQIHSSGKNFEENLLLEYSRIRKVSESGRYIYFYVMNQVWILDKEGFIWGSENELKKFLYDKIDGKKLRFKFR